METSTAAPTRHQSKTLILVEGGVLIALAAVLSLVKIYKLPWGGSITLLSMLPICMFSIKHGVKKGLVISGMFALVQLFMDLGEIMGWGLTPGILIACFLLDYLLAFTMLGFAGLFRKKGTPGAIAGIVTALLLRLFSHVLSGALIWKSVGEVWNLNISNQWLYSLLYNGSFMIPEIVFTVIGAVILLKIPQMKSLLGQDNS